MNLAIETMFGSESKPCACGLEVRHQKPSKRAGGEDTEDREREVFEAVAAEAGLRSQVKGTFCHAMCVADKEACAVFRMETQTMHLRPAGALQPPRTFNNPIVCRTKDQARAELMGLDYTAVYYIFCQFESSF